MMLRSWSGKDRDRVVVRCLLAGERVSRTLQVKYARGRQGAPPASANFSPFSFESTDSFLTPLCSHLLSKWLMEDVVKS